jgi:hypothetical protein
LNLPEGVKAQAEAQATAAGYTSLDQYICSLIQGDESEAVDGELEAELLRGLDSGPSVPLTPALLDEIKRRSKVDRY